MYNFEFRPLAEIDIQEIVKYYDENNPKVAYFF